MFSYLQSRIRGTASPGPGAPPPGLLAFYWHFVRQTKGWYALMFVTSLAVALIDTVIPVFIGKLVSLMEAGRPPGGARAAVAAARGHGGAGAHRPPAGDAGRRRDPPQRADPGRDQPDPLAEPLARGAPELAVLPERFRRAHRQPRDADRQRAARERDGEHTRRLVHRGLRRERVRADGGLGLAAGRADASVVRRLPRVPALLRAAHARSGAAPARRCART